MQGTIFNLDTLLQRHAIHDSRKDGTIRERTASSQLGSTSRLVFGILADIHVRSCIFSYVKMGRMHKTTRKEVVDRVVSLADVGHSCIVHQLCSSNCFSCIIKLLSLNKPIFTQSSVGKSKDVVIQMFE